VTHTLENTTDAPAITAAQLAELVLGRSTAVIVQDPTGTVHSADYLSRVQLDDPDTVVLLTRDEAVAILEEQAQAATQALRAAGVIL
jgi:hypothetical protein